MRLTVGCALIGLFASAVLRGETPNEPKMIDYRDIPEHVQILGKLRLPLGRIVSIKGVWTQASPEKPSYPVFLVQQIDGKSIDFKAEFEKIEAVAPAFEPSLSRVVGDKWELRGVETGGFIGFSKEVLKELPGNRPVSSPAPNGFLTKFCFVQQNC